MLGVFYAEFGKIRPARHLPLWPPSNVTTDAPATVAGLHGPDLPEFIIYIFSHNISEIAPILLAAAIAFPLVPLSALQVLSIDLGSDILPALAGPTCWRSPTAQMSRSARRSPTT